MARLLWLATVLAVAAAASAASRAPVRNTVDDDALERPSIQAILELPTGFAASMICSGVFVAGLPLEIVVDEDCDLACLVSNYTVNYAERSVTVAIVRSGAWPMKAIWRGDGIGCTLIDGLTEAELRAQDVGDQAPLPALNSSVSWPLGDLPSARDLSVDWAAVEASVEADFACERCNTRAVTIAYKGQLMYERYRTDRGVGPTTRLLGWSATKSVTNAFVGLLVGEGRLRLDDPAPVPEWSVDPEDPRRPVTLRQLLHMASGQLWRESSGDVRCLFTGGEGDCAAWYANQPQEVPPGSRYEYSTGSSTLIMRTVLQQRGDPEYSNFEWARQKLFKRIAMTSALIEAQPNTYLLGGSHAYMTARDWLRYGQLYVRDGVWADGTRILPEGWVDETRTPSPTGTNNGYGLHFAVRSSNGVPYISMNGFRDQHVYVVFDKDLVITRHSMPPLTGGGWNQGIFLDPIVAAFPDVPRAA